MTCAQGLLRLLWGGGPEVGVLRDWQRYNVKLCNEEKLGFYQKNGLSATNGDLSKVGVGFGAKREVEHGKMGLKISVVELYQQADPTFA